MTPESTILRVVRLALGSRPDVRLWRNSVGAARFPDGHVLRYGLCPGSSDLIGLLRMPCGCARFLAVEVKSFRGRLEPAQARFLALVEQFGGVAIVARSADEAQTALGQTRSCP